MDIYCYTKLCYHFCAQGKPLKILKAIISSKKKAKPPQTFFGHSVVYILFVTVSQFDVLINKYTLVFYVPFVKVTTIQAVISGQWFVLIRDYDSRKTEDKGKFKQRLVSKSLLMART